MTRNEKYLNIRTFSDSHKSVAYQNQKGICTKCDKPFMQKEMEAHHITPWSKGGKTNPKNCQMLCRECHRRISVI